MQLIQYQHHFEGFLLNRVPLLRKAKWRLVGTANVIYGGLSQPNNDINSPYTPEGEETLPLDILTLDLMLSSATELRTYSGFLGLILYTGCLISKTLTSGSLLLCSASSSIYNATHIPHGKL